MDITKFDTIVKFAGLTTEKVVENLEGTKDRLLLDLQNQKISSVARDLIKTEVTRINQIINTKNHE